MSSLWPLTRILNNLFGVSYTCGSSCNRDVLYIETCLSLCGPGPLEECILRKNYSLYV